MRLFTSVIHPAMSDQTIHPTHRCFDDALELLERRVRHEPAIATNNTILLVHGVIRGAEEQGDIGRIAHAWLEERRADGSYIVWDAGIWQGQRIVFSVEIAEYYGASRVERDTVVRYTPSQVWDENKRSGHYGPWRADLAALCRYKGNR
jgi:hypothetical protein